MSEKREGRSKVGRDLILSLGNDFILQTEDERTDVSNESGDEERLSADSYDATEDDLESEISEMSDISAMSMLSAFTLPFFCLPLALILYHFTSVFSFLFSSFLSCLSLLLPIFVCQFREFGHRCSGNK